MKNKIKDIGSNMDKIMSIFEPISFSWDIGSNMDIILSFLWKHWKSLEIQVFPRYKNHCEKWPFLPVSGVLDRPEIKILNPPPHHFHFRGNLTYSKKIFTLLNQWSIFGHCFLSFSKISELWDIEGEKNKPLYISH